MNNILNVKIAFQREGNKQQSVSKNLRTGAVVKSSKIDKLISDLERVKEYYLNRSKLIEGLIIDVNYNDIIAKSSRITELLKPVGKGANDIVVGARFSDAPQGKETHIITYYADWDTVEKTIDKLKTCKEFLDSVLQGEANAYNFNEKWNRQTGELSSPIKKEEYEKFDGKKSKIRNLVVDCSVVESFGVPSVQPTEEKETYLITFFNTEMTVDGVLEKLGISYQDYIFVHYGSDTISARAELYERLHAEIPFLISMISNDLSKYVLDDEEGEEEQKIISYIPNPTTEPVIGVIDTLFDDRVYFSEWVENKDYIEDFEHGLIQEEHKIHGTEVTSIIVDGPSLNPWLDDGCGRFKVRHFGVCLDQISISRLVKKIKDIVNENPDFSSVP